MYGWRARIGRISPSPETVGCEEWRRSMPDGVCLVETRTLIHDVVNEGLARMVEQVERAASELASARVDLILQAGTAAAFFKGFGHDQDLIQRITRATGLPATTTLTAMVEALRALGARRLLVATAYLPDMDERLAAVLQETGFDVLATRGLGLRASLDMGDQPPTAAYRLALQMARQASADALVVSCGNLRTFEIIDALEADSGLPVVTSNQAGLWQALRLTGIEDRLPGLGRLLRDY